jgi:hypothetical protein
LLLFNSQNLTKIEELDSSEDDNGSMENLTKNNNEDEEDSEEAKRQKYKKLSWSDRFAKFIKVVKECVSKVNLFERANNNKLG